MKRFCYRVIRFIFLSIMVTVLLVIVNFTISYNTYFDKGRDEYSGFEETDIGIFGHSHTETSINDILLGELTKSRVKNYSKSAFPMLNAVILADKLIQNSANPTIIFSFTNNHLGNKGTIHYLFGANYYMNNLKMMFHYYSMKELRLFFEYDYALFIQAVLRKITYYKPLKLGFLKVPVRDRKEEDFMDQEILNWTYKHKNADPQLELHVLQNFIEANPKIEIFLIRTPVWPTYFDKYNNEEEFEAAISLLTQYANVQFLDFANVDYSINYFDDIAHLNKVGANKFTRMLVDKIN